MEKITLLICHTQAIKWQNLCGYMFQQIQIAIFRLIQARSFYVALLQVSLLTGTFLNGFFCTGVIHLLKRRKKITLLTCKKTIKYYLQTFICENKQNLNMTERLTAYNHFGVSRYTARSAPFTWSFSCYPSP
jgi:hypothetical protein